MPPLHVRDLLATGALQEARLLAGAGGLDHAVSGVEVRELAHCGAAPGLICVVDMPAHSFADTHLVDIALRRLHHSGGAALLLCGPAEQSLPEAPLHLAERLRLPLLTVPGQSSNQLATDLLLWIRGPLVQSAHQLSEIARTLRTSSRTLDEVTGTLARGLHAEVAALAADGATIAGTDLGAELMPYLQKPAPVTGELPGHTFAAHPLRGDFGAPEMWLAARSAHGGALWRERALSALALGEAYASVWLSKTLMAAERDARFRTNLLSEILTAGDAVPASTAAVAARTGWRLTGWHTAIHLLRIPGHQSAATFAAAATAEDLARALAGAHIPLGPLVERSDGWAGWTSTDRPPRPHDGAALADRVAEALRDYGSRRDATPLVAGIGRPAHGPGGLAVTMDEARHAALATALADVPGGVQHVDRLGVTQVLMASCSSPAMRETAHNLLAPLLADHAGQDLLRTLDTYLDSGTSTTLTARQLNLHRNTVTQRIARACGVLGVDLDSADERLAVQLACRAHRLGA